MRNEARVGSMGETSETEDQVFGAKARVLGAGEEVLNIWGNLCI